MKQKKTYSSIFRPVHLGSCSTSSCICRRNDSFLKIATPYPTPRERISRNKYNMAETIAWYIWMPLGSPPANLKIQSMAWGSNDPLFPSSPAEAARFPVLPAMFSSMPCSCRSRPWQKICFRESKYASIPWELPFLLNSAIHSVLCDRMELPTKWSCV